MSMSEVIFSGAGRPDGFVLVEAEKGSVAHPDRSATRMMSDTLVFIFSGEYMLWPVWWLIIFAFEALRLPSIG